MFTDIVGYTALMSRDEESAMEHIPGMIISTNTVFYQYPSLVSDPGYQAIVQEIGLEP